MTDFTTETETDFTRKNLPPLSDGAFWRNLRVQTNTTKPMSRIAAELGVDLDDLCAWIMAYTDRPAPKKKEYVNRDSQPAEHERYTTSQSAQRFAVWRKQQERAAATRRMLELSHD